MFWMERLMEQFSLDCYSKLFMFSLLSVCVLMDDRFQFCFICFIFWGDFLSLLFFFSSVIRGSPWFPSSPTQSVWENLQFKLPQGFTVFQVFLTGSVEFHRKHCLSYHCRSSQGMPLRALARMCVLSIFLLRKTGPTKWQPDEETQKQGVTQTLKGDVGLHTRWNIECVCVCVCWWHFHLNVYNGTLELVLKGGMQDRKKKLFVAS